MSFSIVRFKSLSVRAKLRCQGLFGSSANGCEGLRNPLPSTFFSFWSGWNFPRKKRRRLFHAPDRPISSTNGDGSRHL